MDCKQISLFLKTSLSYFCQNLNPKKMSKLIKLFLLSLILLSGVAVQAQKTKPQKAYEFRDLNKFIGIWESTATITVDSVPYTVTYRMNFRKTADSYGINMDESYSDSTLGNLRAANLIGFGYDDKKIHWYYVDNMGTTYERVGHWVDTDNLTFTYATKNGEKKYDEVITYALKGNDMFSYKQMCYLDGKEVKKVTGRFTRKQQAVAPQPKK
jgi:hypothetical protein